MSDHDPHARKFRRGLGRGLAWSIPGWLFILAIAYFTWRSLS